MEQVFEYVILLLLPFYKISSSTMLTTFTNDFGFFIQEGEKNNALFRYNRALMK